LPDASKPHVETVPRFVYYFADGASSEQPIARHIASFFDAFPRACYYQFLLEHTEWNL
jgi:hypothetical protein